jgi:DinB family protein
MTDEQAVRDHLRRLLDWEEAHVNFDKAVAGIPPRMRGAKPKGLPYSAWQLIEHLRIAQHDILDFCRNPDYKERKWPDDYWPSAAAPPSAAAWDRSIRQFRKDRKALQQLAMDASIDLAARIPHGNGQTYLRELVLAADHAAYHTGELVLLRRMLGIWKSG